MHVLLSTLCQARRGLCLLCLLALTAAAVHGEVTPFAPLDPTAAGQHLPGKFVWADLVTDDATAADRFYSGMFGWKFSGEPSYRIASHRGRPVAGIQQRTPPPDQAAASGALWIGYVSVADVKAAGERVAAEGGKQLVAPAHLVGRGVQAVFADPDGAIFGVIHSSSGDPKDDGSREGDWLWMQLLSRDADRSAAFYGKLATYQRFKYTPADRPPEIYLSTAEVARGSIRMMPKGGENMRPFWLPYVRVASLKTSIDTCGKLGGKVLVAPRPDLIGGRAAILEDPTGAAVGVLEWNQNEALKAPTAPPPVKKETGN